MANFTKSELNKIIHYIMKYDINTTSDIVNILSTGTDLSISKTNEILRYLEKRHCSTNYEEIFSFYKKRINKRKSKSIQSRRSIIENKYNQKISNCWN